MSPRVNPPSSMSLETPLARASPPRTEHELLQRAEALAGLRLRDVADRHQVTVPSNLRRAKGWLGSLLETNLGASAGSRSEPDFVFLGVELKTLPIGRDGRPKETTYVCSVPLLEHSGLKWQSSCVRRKLEHVLWIPFEAERDMPVGERRLGFPLLWSPSVDEERMLRADWEELMEMVSLGRIEAITAHHGTCLQIRPKAANSRVRRLGVGTTGASVPTLPRGFYLRTTFTESILRRSFIMP